MKRLWKICLALLACLLMPLSVRADSPGDTPDYYTDYYVVVESADGSIDIYSEASANSTKLNNDPIPNGTALHIEGEKMNEGRNWGYVEYHGMNGYVPLDVCRMKELSEAVESEILLGGSKDVDYDVEVDSQEGSVALYRGPGEKFGVNGNLEAIENGEKLHISQEVEGEDGSKWGMTSKEGMEGWVNLEDTKKCRTEKMCRTCFLWKMRILCFHQGERQRQRRNLPQRQRPNLPQRQRLSPRQRRPQRPLQHQRRPLHLLPRQNLPQRRNLPIPRRLRQLRSRRILPQLQRQIRRWRLLEKM